MRRRTPARWLAPVALVTCAVAIYAVVEGTLTKDQSGGSTQTVSTTTTTTTRQASTRTTKRKSPKRAKSYTVKAGDVLSAIAARTGVSVAKLEELNPNVDAQTLRPGQKLKLSK